MPLVVPLIVVLAISGVVLLLLRWTFAQPWAARLKIRPEPGPVRLTAERMRVTSRWTSALPPVLVLGAGLLLFDSFLHTGELVVVDAVIDFFAILLIYDFVYYLAHRFLFHGELMFRQHAVHHGAKYPQVQHSLHVHPLETATGILLLLLSTWLVGPVHVDTFAATFLVYSIMNLAIHCGLDFGRFPLRFLGYMARVHDTHHKGMNRGNYASITPIFDLLFGTSE